MSTMINVKYAPSTGSDILFHASLPVVFGRMVYISRIFFGHPFYGTLDSVNKAVIMDVHGTSFWTSPWSDWRSETQG